MQGLEIASVGPNFKIPISSGTPHALVTQSDSVRRRQRAQSYFHGAADALPRRRRPCADRCHGRVLRPARQRRTADRRSDDGDGRQFVVLDGTGHLFRSTSRRLEKITDAVHAKGGRIFLQIWHGGRAFHSLLNNGAQPVAPSAMPITGDEVHTPEGKKPYVEPRALHDDELPGIVGGFKKAAENAKAAGFNGVEVHGANGYLLDEFLRDGANKRNGPYGSIENRARLLCEVIEAICTVWGSDRVGVRLSPLNSFNSMIDSDPVTLISKVAAMLNRFNLAYLHVMRGDFFQQQKAAKRRCAETGARPFQRRADRQHGIQRGGSGTGDCRRQGRCGGIRHALPRQSGPARTHQGQNTAECAKGGDVLHAGAPSFTDYPPMAT